MQFVVNLEATVLVVPIRASEGVVMGPTIA